MTFGWIVYAGGVIVAVTIFISFVLTAFPANAYFSRFIMTVAGILVGGSMIAFPVALHKWAIEKSHRKWTMSLYYGEMIVIAVNTVVGFSSLMAKYTGTPAPEWVVLYEPFSIVAIIYTVAAWGTVFLKDPAHKSTVKELTAIQLFNDNVSGKLNDFVNSEDGLRAIQRAAEHKIAKIFDTDKYDTTPKPFVRQPEVFSDYESNQKKVAEMLRSMEGEGDTGNPPTARRSNGK